MTYVLLLHLHTYLKKTRRKEKRNWIDFLSSYFKRALVTLCWFHKAHHLVTVVIRTVLFFSDVPRLVYFGSLLGRIT